MIKNNLAVLMAERGLNIQDVANETGLSRTTISALVNELGKGIQFDTMDELCELLKVTPGQLFTFISLSVDINAISVDEVEIEEKWEGVIIDEKNELDFQSHDVNCVLTLNIKIRQDGHIFNAPVQFSAYLGVVEGSMLKLFYSYKLANGLDIFLNNTTYFIKQTIIEKIEDALLEHSTDHFDFIERIGSITIDSGI